MSFILKGSKSTGSAMPEQEGAEGGVNEIIKKFLEKFDRFIINVVGTWGRKINFSEIRQH